MSNSTSTPNDASRTVTIHDSQPIEQDSPAPSTVGSLRVRGAPRNTHRVAWDDDVVDNEGCGRKSSKICCIYHKPRKFDESSDEDSSDSDSDHEHSHHSHSHKPNGEHAEGSSSERNAYEAAPKGKGRKS